MPHEIATPTTCTICGKTFYGPTLTKEQQGPAFMRYVQKLLAHLAKQHPQVTQQSAVKTAEFQGWMLLGHFESKDPQVIEQRDYFRWSTHQSTLAARAQNLETRAREVAKDFIGAKLPALSLLGKLAQDHSPLMEDALRERYGPELGNALCSQENWNGYARELERDLATAIENVLDELVEILEEPDKYVPEVAKEGPRLVS